MRKVLMILATFMTTAVFGETWYIRPAGSAYGTGDGHSYTNAKSGFSGLIWGKGLGKIGENDQVYIAGTHKTGLIVGASGTTNLPNKKLYFKSCETKFGASVDDKGIINCFQGITNWVALGNGVYKSVTAGSFTVQPYFVAQNEIPQMIAGDTSCTNGRKWFWNSADREIYYRPISGAPQNVVYPSWYTGITLDNRSFIEIWGMTIKGCNVGIRTFATATQGAPSAAITVRQCYITSCIDGFFSIAGNVGAQSGIVVYLNAFEYVGRGVAMYASGIGTYEHVGCSVLNNKFDGIGYTGSGVEEWQTALYADPNAYVDQEGIGMQNTVSCIIERNTIWGACDGIALYAQENAKLRNNIVRYNSINGANRSGIIIYGHWNAAEYAGNQIYYNSIQYVYLDNDGVDQYAIFLAGPQYPRVVGWNSCVNNTLFFNEIGIYVSRDASYWQIKNNIIESSKSYHLKSTHAQVNKDWNNNCYWWDKSDGWFYNGTNYNFSSFKIATGQDANSIVAGSGIDPATMHLSTNTSPCINAGVYVGLTNDFDGQPIVGNPDIGFDEY